MFFLCIAAVSIPYAVYFLVRRFYLENKLVPNLKGRAVFITGCDTGFGHDLALRFITEGIKCFAGCLTEDGASKLRQEARQYTSLLRTVVVDVTNQKSLKGAVDFVSNEQKKIGLWAVVCNAGIAPAMVPDDWLSIDDYIRTSDVNLWGVIRTCHAFKMLIKATKGRFVIVTSQLARFAAESAGPYVVSKYGAEAYGDTLRREMRHFGVTVHLLEPGFFRTPISAVEAQQKGFQNKHEALSNELKLQYDDSNLRTRLKSMQFFLKNFVCENPNLVVDAYFHAVTSLYPRKRYVIGLDAKMMYIPLSYLPESVQDTAVGIFATILGAPRPNVYAMAINSEKNWGSLGSSG